jgi:uncharacterized protein YecT (DUF1311 family)
MIRLLGVIITMSLFVPSGVAQASDPLQRCLDTAATQSEVNRCAREEVQRAQAELKDVYDTLLAVVGNDAQARAKIIAAEKAWVEYCTAYMEAMWPADDKRMYGSMFVARASIFGAKLTRQHIEDVKELLKKHSGQNAH